MFDWRARFRGPCAWVGVCLLVAGGLIAAPTFGSPGGHKRASPLLVVTPKKPVFKVRNARPGTRVARTVKVRYLGKRPARLLLGVRTKGSKPFSSRLRIFVTAKGRLAYSSRLSAFKPRAAGKIKRGQTVTFRISLLLPKGASPAIDNPFQARASKISFVWKAVQLG